MGGGGGGGYRLAHGLFALGCELRGTCHTSQHTDTRRITKNSIVLRAAYRYMETWIALFRDTGG